MKERIMLVTALAIALTVISVVAVPTLGSEQEVTTPIDDYEVTMLSANNTTLPIANVQYVAPKMTDVHVSAITDIVAIDNTWIDKNDSTIVKETISNILNDNKAVVLFESLKYFESKTSIKFPLSLDIDDCDATVIHLKSDGTFEIKTGDSYVLTQYGYTINGVYKYSGSLTINGELEVNGILNAVSSDPYITVNSTGKLTVNSANKGDFYTYTGVRVSGGTLVINSDSFNASQKLWMLNGATNVIELNSDASLYSFCWITDSKTQIIFDGESVLHLKNLSSNNGDYWSRALDETIGLELVNYKNGLIQVDRLTDNSWTDPDRTKNATDNLEYIVADGFEAGSMEWVWHDETSTYWLEGAAIPEPSVFAFLFGGFASVYILVRRTKKIR